MDKSFQIVERILKSNKTEKPFRFTFGTNNLEMIPNWSFHLTSVITKLQSKIYRFSSTSPRNQGQQRYELDISPEWRKHHVTVNPWCQYGII
jgi:hypothetical protein